MIGTLYIPTRDRPQALAEAVRGHFARARNFGRSLEVVVIGDWSDPAETARWRAASVSLGGRVRIAGTADKRAYVEQLIREGIERGTAELALLGDGDLPDYGANRNAILLDGVGECLLASDDDILGVVAETPGRCAGLTACAGDPTELWFFGDTTEAYAAAPAVDVDWIALHEERLGQPFADVELPTRTGSRFERRLGSPHARVVASWTGFVGDVASTSPLLYLVARGASRDRLLASEAHWHKAIASRQVLRGVTRATLGDGAFFTPGAAALDARALLPPFPPVLRGEGTVFGQWLRICCEGALVAYLPHVVRHQPPDSRHGSVEELHRRAAAGVGLGIMLMSALGGFVVPSGDDAARMRGLGRYYVELASRDWTAPVRRSNSELYARLDGQLRSHERAPMWWARELETFIGAMREAERRSDYAVPTDLRELPDARDRTARLLVGVGKLLESWPDMVAAARRLRERDVRIAS